MGQCSDTHTPLGDGRGSWFARQDEVREVRLLLGTRQASRPPNCSRSAADVCAACWGDTVPVHGHPQGCQGERSLELKPLQPTLYAEWLINVPHLPRDCARPISRPSPRRPRSSPGKRLSLPALSESKNPFRRTL